MFKEKVICLIATAMVLHPLAVNAEMNHVDSGSVPDFGFMEVEGKKYWYENSTRQGVYGDPKNVRDVEFGEIERGREIYDPDTDAWYWLDAVYDGAAAYGKEVWLPYIYQDEDNWDDAEIRMNADHSDEGMADFTYQSMKEKTGKWVRYDANGKMLKGWVTINGDLEKVYPEQAGNTYYYDHYTGLMAKGDLSIDGVEYHFDKETGVLDDGNEISFRKPNDEHIVYVESDDTYYVDNEILLVAKEGVVKEQVLDIIGSIDGKIVAEIDVTNDYQIELEGKKSKSELNEILEVLSSNILVESVSLHNLEEVACSYIPDDSKWENEEWSTNYPQGINWGVEAIHSIPAWDHVNDMSYVKAGIIDSMFDGNHEDIAYTQIWNNPDSISAESLGYEDRSHGTHVSGTMAACYDNKRGIAGVAPKINLYAYSILGTDTDEVTTDRNKVLMGFMEWKYALANLITSGCKVINVSMGKGSLRSEEYLNNEATIYGNFLNKLINQGYEFVIVQAAGNDHRDARTNGIFCHIDMQPARDRIIVVGAIGNNGSHKNGLFGWFGERVFDGYYYAGFSNYGERVDVVAPGVDIYSTVPGNRYEGGWDGTSMAAPHVSGVAAMCFSINPTVTGAQVKQIIINSSTESIQDNNEEHDTLLSYPLVNAEAAINMAINTHGQAVSPSNPTNGIVMGNVRGYNDAHEPITIDDVNVSAYKVSSSTGNISGLTASTRTDGNGNYELVLEPGTYYINIYREGYLPFSIVNVTVANDDVTFLDNVILIRDGVEVTSIISGTVRNALTGSEVEGVTVKFRPGWDNRNGELAKLPNSEQEAIVSTNISGVYSIEMLENCYTAEFSKDGYITGYANVICASMSDIGQDAALTPILSEDEYRVILTWGSEPSDLDSHLSGVSSEFGQFHVAYYEMSAYDKDANLIASLDLDDTSSYGPETITFRVSKNGRYKYSVHDYTNSAAIESNALSNSRAKVEVYKGNSLFATYNVPVNTGGTVWNVFEIDGETLRVINTMEYIDDPRLVCAFDTGDPN